MAAPRKTIEAVTEQYNAAFIELAEQTLDLASAVEQQLNCLEWARENDAVTPQCFKRGEMDALLRQFKAILPDLEGFANALQSGRYFAK